MTEEHGKNEEYFALKNAFKETADAIVSIKSRSESLRTHLLNKKKINKYLDELKGARDKYVTSVWDFIDEVYEDFEGEKAKKIVNDGIYISRQPGGMEGVVEIVYTLLENQDLMNYKDHIIKIIKSSNEFRECFIRQI